MKKLCIAFAVAAFAVTAFTQDKPAQACKACPKGEKAACCKEGKACEKKADCKKADCPKAKKG